VEILGGIESNQRRHLLGVEGGITPPEDIPQVPRGDLAGGNVQRKYLMGEVGKGKMPPTLRPVRWQGRNLFRYEEAAVRGEALEHDFFKRQLRTTSSAKRGSRGLEKRGEGGKYPIGAASRAQVPLRRRMGWHRRARRGSKTRRYFYGVKKVARQKAWFNVLGISFFFFFLPHVCNGKLLSARGLFNAKIAFFPNLAYRGLGKATFPWSHGFYTWVSVGKSNLGYVGIYNGYSRHHSHER
jgi:hypothetical protein